MKGIATFIIFLTVFANDVKAQGPQSYSTALETQLRTDLFTDYEVLQRPAQTVPVSVSMNLITINSLDIKTQTLSTSGFFQMSWNNSNLSWKNDSTYDNINYIFSNEDYMWRPAIVIENSATDLKVFSDTNTLIRVISSGQAMWTPGGIFQTSCEADVTYYPLDVQECSIVLTTWAYTNGEISLSFGSEPFILDNYSENGEWEIIETSTSVESAERSRDSNSYDRLYFTMKLRRRPLYHILNTIFPVILMSCLIIFVFKLPPESGERVGMSLTVLLAYAVYLTLISDSFPQTSLSASILSTYLTIILMLSTLSVIFTIVVLDIYFNHEEDESPPAWLQKFTKYFLVKVAFWKDETCCSKSKVTPSVTDLNRHEKMDLNFGREKGITQVQVQEKDNESMDGEPGEKYYSWKEVALILDRFFMYLFIFMVVSSTAICLGMMTSAT